MLARNLSSSLCAALLVLAAMPVLAEDAKWPNYKEADFTVKDYVFKSGESLPELKIHYRTLGTPKRNGAGDIVNAVLLLQGNTGTGANWLRPSLADELFKRGQPFDAAQYFLIIPDALGRGGSSKPSDGLRASFRITATTTWSTPSTGSSPTGSASASAAGHRQLARLHARWMWAEMYPDMMDSVVALSCQPTEISGRNWIMRHAAAEAIRHDPDYKDGNYEKQPSHYVYSAAAGAFNTESPARIQELAPTRAAADALYEKRLTEERRDANDQLYAIESIIDYNPEPGLDKIKAKVLLINDSEGCRQPADLGNCRAGDEAVKNARTC
jgi:homoserine O-acetyltransferase